MANRRKVRRGRSFGEHSLNAGKGFEAEVRSLPASFPAELHGEAVGQEVRPEKVARARRLVQDENYPQREVIESVAELLARHLQPDPDG